MVSSLLVKYIIFRFLSSSVFSRMNLFIMFYDTGGDVSVSIIPVPDIRCGFWSILDYVSD